MKIAVIVAAGLALAVAASAQVAPDRFCEGLAAMVKSAGETPPFVSLGKDGAGIARPVGMEGAHSCDATKGGPGMADKLTCSWLFGGDRGDALPARIKTCAVVSGWAKAPVQADEKVVSARFVKPGSTLEVVALSSPTRGNRAETLTVFARRK